VSASGELACTRDDTSAALSVAVPTGDEFVAVAAGTVQVCGLRADGTIHCGAVAYLSL
jgi:hypothetical protein